MLVDHDLSQFSHVEPHRFHSAFDQRPIVRREGKLLDKALELNTLERSAATSLQELVRQDQEVLNETETDDDTPETVEEKDPELFEEMTCPGEWRERVGYQKPFLCPSVKKKPNCTWNSENLDLGEACNTSCFCDPSGDIENVADENEDSSSMAEVDIQQCKRMCKDTDPCFFTFITDEVGQKGQCRVYTECADKEDAPPSLSDASNGMVWKTCERFFGNYTDKTIALHSPWYNRFLLLDHKGKAVPSHKEIDINMASSITTAMRFVVTSTENIAKRNKEGEETVEAVEEDEKTEKQQKEAAHGGPGIIALYNSNNGDGQHWMSIDDAGNMVGEQHITDSSLFIVCYLGPGQIALYNTGNERYVQMTNDGIQATGRLDCCKPPKELKGVRFSVLTLAPLQSTAGHVTKETEPAEYER